MFNEKLVMAYLELFDLMDLKDLVWVNDADLDTLEYSGWKLELQQNYKLMVDLLKFIFY
jgi:hypothetical protein